MSSAGQSRGSTGEEQAELIDIEVFKKIDLRIGLVKHAERVLGSKKLIRLVVDLGGEERQVVAGLAEWYSPEYFVNKHVVVVANLKPRKLMGLESRGMILATCDRGKPVLLTVAEPVEPGSKVC